MMNDDITYDDIHETHNFDLLDKTFVLFRKLFPDDRELKDLDKVQQYMCDSEANPKILITVAVVNKEPIAFIVGEYYRESTAGLVIYLGKRPGFSKYQTHPLHMRLRDNSSKEARKDGKKFLAAFSEVARPDKEKLKFRTIDPVKRIRIMERFGAKIIPIVYYYPIKGLFRYKYYDDAYLMCYPVEEKYAIDNPSIIKDFLTELYLSEGLKKDNKYLKKMFDEIDQMKMG